MSQTQFPLVMRRISSRTLPKAEVEDSATAVHSSTVTVATEGESFTIGKSEQSFEFSEIEMQVFGYLKWEFLLLRMAPVCREWYRNCKDILCEHKALDLSKKPVESEEVSSYGGLDFTLSKSSASILPKSFVNVREVNLAGQSNVVDDEYVGKLLQQFSKNQLQAINLNRCAKITVNSLQHIARYSSDSLISLQLDKCNLIQSLTMLRSCKNLTALDISGCRFVKDDSFQELAQTLQNLRSLKCAGCRLISDEGLRPLLGECYKTLQELCVDNTRVSDQTLLYLSSLFRSYINHEPDKYNPVAIEFQSLSASGCQRIGDEAVTALTSQVGHAVRSLNISKSLALTDAGVQNIALYCRDIENLDLSQCENVSNLALHAIAENCGSLQSLNLEKCPQITDIGLIQIARACPHLKSISAAKNKRVTDDFLLILAQFCPELENLNVIGSPYVSDSGVKVVVSACRKLRLLHACSCLLITNTTTEYLSEFGANLIYVDLSNCPMITQDGIDKLKSKHPKTKVHTSPALARASNRVVLNSELTAALTARKQNIMH